MHLLDRRPGIKRLQPLAELFQVAPRHRVPDEVGLGQQQPVGHRHLAHGFFLAVERAVAVDRVDRGHDPVEPVVAADHGIAHQRVQDRDGIREAGRLDQQPLERRQVALGAARQQVAHGVDQIALDGAADAAALHQDRVVGRRRDQVVVEPDLAELVDDHRGPAHVRPL